jgi:hypothetical protein
LTSKGSDLGHLWQLLCSVENPIKEPFNERENS